MESLKQKLEGFGSLDDIPKRLVLEYVALKSQEPDSISITGRLMIHGSLVSATPLERFEAFYWLLSQKYAAIDSENFEHATVLNDVLEDVEDILFNYKKGELYNAMVDYFVVNQHMDEERVEAEYERFVLESIDFNSSADNDDNFEKARIVAKIAPIYFIKKRLKDASEFSEYLDSRDEPTKIRHKYGLKGHRVSKE